MALLDKKIPPLLLTGLAALGMWLVSATLPGLDLPNWLRVYGALFCCLVGTSFCVAGIVEFRGAQTTIDPRVPESSSSLVTSGIYAVTRNPMYVGFTLVLLAWAIYLESYWSLLIVAGFVAYLDRFQIRPEEEALKALFGPGFEDYRSRVRRWI